MYTSVNNEKIKYLKKLQNKKYRRQTKEFLVEGDHLVKEAYNAHLLKELYVSDAHAWIFEKKTEIAAYALSGNSPNQFTTALTVFGISSFK